MSVNSRIKVWKMEPGLPNYTAGMDLGEPDEVHEATFFIAPVTLVINNASSAKERAKRGVANRKPRKKKSLNREIYLQLQSDGLSRDQICEKYNISIR
ncbi:MAG: hypothetical protein J7559_00020, partial [Cohnella sp.]|nr:hypothetical protein [Cohnella sp.]